MTKNLFFFPLMASIIGFIFAVYLVFFLKSKNESNTQEKEAYSFLREGLKTYLKRKYVTVFWTAFIIVVLLFLFLYFQRAPQGYKQPLAFLTGVIFTSLALVLTLFLNIFSSQKAISQLRKDIIRASNISVSGGGLAGLIIASISIAGLVLVYLFLGIDYLLGYALGVTIIAFFFRVGGGVFATSANMGFNLVKTQEKNIPILDKRNPGTFTDILGGHIGEVAGLGTDLLNSFIIAVTSGIILVKNNVYSFNLVILPFLIAALGIMTSIMGILFAKVLVRRKVQNFLLNSVYLTAILTAVGSFFIIKTLGIRIDEFKSFLNLDPMYSPFLVNIFGLFTGVFVGFTSEYFTSSYHKPVQDMTYSAQMGASLLITHGVRLGMKSTMYMACMISLTILFSLRIAGSYGIAMAALGMLSTIPIIISLNAYRPIADDCRDMTIVYNYDESQCKAAEKLAVIGNTTAAIGRGFANGAATVCALVLFLVFAKISYLSFDKISITSPKLLTGLFLGGMMPYLFSSLLLKGVLISISSVVGEIIRQFSEIPYLWQGKARPDVIKSVDLVTIKSLEALKNPGILILFAPVLIGFILGKIALAGLLIGTLISGLFLAYYLGNTGVALSNLRKYIENNRFGGTGTATHEATCIGDTFGNSLRDALSPSINILMILVSLMAIIIVPFIK